MIIIIVAAIVLTLCVAFYFLPNPEAAYKADATREMNSRMIGDKFQR